MIKIEDAPISAKVKPLADLLPVDAARFRRGLSALFFLVLLILSSYGV